MAGGIKLAPLMTEIKVDIDNFKSDMSKAASIGVNEAERISKELSTTAKVGETMSRVGTTLTRGLTLPIVGAGIAATKMAVDFESNFAKVSTLLDSNVVDYGQYKDEILDASSKSKIAVDEFSEAVYNSISAGVDQTKAVGFTTEAMKLAKGGFTDGAKAVDILTTAINAYGLEASDVTKVSDMLITTQNLGKTTVDELASNMGRAIPTANSYNVNLENVSTALADLTKNGIATAEATTYYNSMLNELGKSGTIADTVLKEKLGKSFSDLQAEGVPLTDCLKVLKDEAEGSGKKLGDMFGSAEAAKAALTIMKDDGAEYNEILKAMESSAGATQTAFEKIDATPAERLKGALNELKNEAIKFGGAFVPVIEKAAGIIGKAADAFSGLSEEQQDNVIKWGLVLAAAGPVLKVVGGGISTYTKLSSVIGGASKAMGVFGTAQTVAAAAAGTTSTAVGSAGLMGTMSGLLGICAPVAAGAAIVGTGLYAIHESSQLAKRGVNEASEEMSIMERIIATLSGTEINSREELEKMGYVHKEFSEEISPEFQKAVEESTKKVQDFNIFLREIGFDNVISEEESNEFNQRVNDTCEEAIQAIQGKKEKSQAALKELFVADDNVIDEGEQRVLEILSQSSDAQIAEVNQLKEEILVIKQAAVDEGRELNEQEIANIEEKNARIHQLELEAIGGTQEEIAYAKNEFNARIKTMDLDSASELMHEKAKARDEEIVQIQASYDTEIEMLKASRAGKSVEERKAISEQIANLEKDKQDKIKIQDDLYQEYLRIIEENNPKLLDGINKYNGEVLNNNDMTSKENLERLKQTYSEIGKITQSGCYETYSTIDGHSAQVAVKVDETSGEIIGIYDKTTGMTGGYCEDMAKSAEKMANSQEASYRQIISAEGMYVDYTTGEVCLANGTAVTSLDALKSATEGAKDKIVDINGTPYKVQVDNEGTISALRSIGDEADYVARDRTITFTAVSTGSALQDKFYNNPNNNHRLFNGVDNVPYDGYQATLHKGERIMTAQENKTYTEAPFKDGPQQPIIVVIEVGGKEVKRELVPILDRELGKLYGRSR